MCEIVSLSVSSIGTNELQPTPVAHQSSLPNRFQFPLSERTNCNVRAQQAREAPGESFSFLYRNERTATSDVVSNPAQTIELSVSSIGTNELQLLRVWNNDPKISLSVSSIGTNELQLE